MDLKKLPLFDETEEDLDTPCRRLDYMAEMKFDNNFGPAQFTIFHDGQRQAKASVSVEFHDKY